MTPYELALRAKEAKDGAARLSEERKNSVLRRLASMLSDERTFLFEENKKDVVEAERIGLPRSLIERLRIDEKVVREMGASLMDVAALPDPVYEIEGMWKRPNGLLVGRMRIPIGVILIIYESRPNVTIEAFSLCLKSGNVVILKGGSEAFHSNLALYSLIRRALEEEGVSPEVVQFVSTKDHSYVNELLKLDELIDLVIPRGGEELIRTVVRETRIPVLKHYKGVCHVFVDASADLSMAEEICVNAKVQKPATCNAMETLLVHKQVAPVFLPPLAERLRKVGVRLKGCPETLRIVREGIEEATEQDWYEEYLDLVLSIRVVRGLDEAIAHIKRYGSNHTDAIVTRDYVNAMRFIREVDSSLVLVNASTRLNDGYQLGLGAEMGISTTKLHAFGPMGLKELTVTKFIAFGDGQLRF
jgi:glutamate-5-semialdehyde dehydrogenase